MRLSKPHGVLILLFIGLILASYKFIREGNQNLADIFSLPTTSSITSQDELYMKSFRITDKALLKEMEFSNLTDENAQDTFHQIITKPLQVNV